MYLKKDRLLNVDGYQFYGMLDMPDSICAYFLYVDACGDLYVQQKGKVIQVGLRYIKTPNRDPNIADEYVRANLVGNVVCDG